MSIATDGTSAFGYTRMSQKFHSILKKLSSRCAYCTLRQSSPAFGYKKTLVSACICIPLQNFNRELNKIRYSSLNDIIFSQLCVDNDENFNRLLLYTEVRWLSKDTCQTRFYNLFVTVIEFLKNKDTGLRENLTTSKNDITYSTDLYILFNNVNLQFRGDDLN